MENELHHRPLRNELAIASRGHETPIQNALNGSGIEIIEPARRKIVLVYPAVLTNVYAHEHRPLFTAPSRRIRIGRLWISKRRVNTRRRVGCECYIHTDDA